MYNTRASCRRLACLTHPTTSSSNSLRLENIWCAALQFNPLLWTIDARHHTCACCTSNSTKMLRNLQPSAQFLKSDLLMLQVCFGHLLQDLIIYRFVGYTPQPVADAADGAAHANETAFHEYASCFYFQPLLDLGIVRCKRSQAHEARRRP